jgi:hypothetical protein
MPGTLHLADSPSFSIRDLPKVTFDLHRWDGGDGRHTVDLTINTSAVPGLVVGWAEIPLAQDGNRLFSEQPDVKEFLEDKPRQPAQADPDMGRRMAALSPDQVRGLEQARVHLRPIVIDGREIPFQEGPPHYQIDWLRWLQLLTQRTSLGVVSDYFTEWPGGTLDPIHMTVREALEEARRAFHRRWVKSGSLLSFRHERWYQLRPAEPPQRVLDAVGAAFREKNRLDLEDLSLAGELDLAQVTVAASLKMPCGWVLEQHPATMRLLHALTRVERRIAQGNGLTLRSLGSPVARECFKTAAWTIAPTLEEAQMGQLIFLIRQRVDDRNNLSLAFRWAGPQGDVGAETVRLAAGER